jgi:photosystem II stability/assembly factor-like uncharacterized protein
MRSYKSFFICLFVVAALLTAYSWSRETATAQERVASPRQESEREARQRRLAEMRPQPANDAEYARSLMAAARRERAINGHLLPGAPVNHAIGPALEIWNNLGPSSSNGSYFDSGRLSGIVTHPDDGNVIYVASAGGGVWKTTNGGNSWSPKTESVGSLGCGALAMDPFDPDTLYLGLGDPHRTGILGLGTAPGLGVLKTTDGGAHWSEPVLLGDSTNIRSLLVNIFNKNIVMAGTNKGLFRSTDAGASYQPVALGATAQEVWSLAWAGGANFVLSSKVLNADYVIGAIGRIYYSTDQGATWTQATGYPNDLRRITLAAGTQHVLYALAERGADAEIYKSTNAGQTWSPLNIAAKDYTNFDESVDKILGSQGDYNQMVIVSPSNPNIAYFGGQKRLIKTSNGGASFSLVSSDNPQSMLFDYVHADIHCAAFTKTGGLLVGTDGGIFKTTNNGANWSSALNDGLITHLVHGIASTKDNPNVVVATLQDNGVMIRRQNNGAFDKIKGGDGYFAVASQSDSDKLLFSTNGGEYQSSDGGASNAAASTIGLPGGAPNRWEQSPHDASGNYLYAVASGKLFRSVNFGLSWHATGTTGLPANHTIRNVASSKVAGALAIIVQGGNSGEVYYTFNNGASWTKAAAVPNADGALVDLAIGPDLQFYAISDGWNHSGNKSRIWTSNDPQAGWLPVAWSGLPDGVRLNVIKADPVSNGVIYAGSDLGLYRSKNKGLSFHRWGYGLPLVSVTDIWIAADGSMYRAGTYGRGVWNLVGFGFSGNP